MVGLNSAKVKFLLIAAIVVTVWAYALTNYGDFLNSLPWVWQFVIVTLPIYAVSAWLIANDTGPAVLRNVAGLIAYSAAVDLLQPPLAVNLQGVVSAQALLAGGAVDTFLANVFTTLGFSGPVLFFLVYPVSFIVLFLVAELLLPLKTIKKALSSGF